MKRSKPINSSPTTPHRSPPEIKSLADLQELQRRMTDVLFRPLTEESRMQAQAVDGRDMQSVADEFIKPNDRLTSFERLEIYNRQYWFRVLDSFYEDYPGVRAVLGETVFLKLAEAYLVKYPSTSFTMRNLGSRLVKFLRDEPHWSGENLPLVLEVARFEWAQIVAFDAAALPPCGIGEVLLAEPGKLTLSLQPHITLLALEHPIDDFVLALKRRDALQGQASNAMDSAPKASKLNKIALPKREKTFVAVHRHQNALYYKRLEAEAFALLEALRKGACLELACEKALRRAAPEVDWSKKIETWFENWSALGWFCQAAQKSE